MNFNFRKDFMNEAVPRWSDALAEELERSIGRLQNVRDTVTDLKQEMDDEGTHEWCMSRVGDICRKYLQEALAAMHSAQALEKKHRIAMDSLDEETRRVQKFLP